MARKITEIKRHVNKPAERYECDLVRGGPGHMVLRYVSDRKFASTRLDMTFPPGCTTIALYWATRPYVFWGIFSPEKELLGYLVHICRDVDIACDSVSYLDMLLDLWFFPDGRHIVMDRDEVEDCLGRGLLGDEDARYIAEAERTAIADFEANSEKLITLANALDILAQPQ